MDILLIVVFLLLGIAELVIYVMVLIKLFKDKGILHGILGIICGIYPFIWGWMVHKRLKITKLMTIWTVAGIIGMGLQVFMGDPEDLMKGLEDRDKVKAVKVVGVQKKPAAVKATKKKKAAAAPMIAVSAQNRSKAAEWSAKAQALWKNGKYTEPQNAIRYLDLAVGLNPNDAVHYNNRGLTKRDLGQYEKAIEDYNRAIELDPKYALAYNNRGVANYELAQYEKAIKDYSQAIRIDPKYVDAYFNQALANYQLDEIDRMCNFFEKACELGACEGFEWAKQESLCK
ncbi:MAG: tetratricopeptide repeat protein [Deltaproteobacteria bacterium]|nr:tetratricopeptide repeat protein [Deltaproteobacteria bacterium]